MPLLELWDFYSADESFQQAYKSTPQPDVRPRLASFSVKSVHMLVIP
ncbi:hypothetical protein C4K15_6114 [Pseudomonas chlororaphis subsp. aurantiaca]|nr:hypothetical protein C4K15_6114 [Pseudomonas chlororaphis subsp. aurantiaca]